MVLCLGLPASRMAAPITPLSPPSQSLQTRHGTLSEGKPDHVNPPHTATGVKPKLLTREHSFLPGLPVPSRPKSQRLALQGQAPVRRDTPLQDALPGTLCHPILQPGYQSLDVHVNSTAPKKLSLDPQMKTNLWYLLCAPTALPTCFMKALPALPAPSRHHKLQSVSQPGCERRKSSPVYPASPGRAQDQE